MATRLRGWSGGRCLLFAGVPALSVRIVTAAPEPTTVKLSLEPRGASQVGVGYYPVRISLGVDKPAGVKKEPKYSAAPKYGTVRIGASSFAVAVDEPEGADWKIYLDANGNGDLTDDGNGNWTAKRPSGNRTMYGTNRYVLPVSWKLADGKSSSGEYGLALYRFTNQDYLLAYREAARVGSITLDGEQHKVALVENDADGLFDKRVADASQARQGRPVWLLIDLNDDGKFDSQGEETSDIRGSFSLGEQVYEAAASPDGSTLTLSPSAKQALNLGRRPPMLAVGKQAPDFDLAKPGGGRLALSDAIKGKKATLINFWFYG